MDSKFKHLKLKILKQEYQYVLLKNDTDRNVVFEKTTACKSPVGIFVSAEEFSIITPIDVSFENVALKTEAGWSCFQIVGEMLFGSVQGLIASISSSLFTEGLGICVVSTFKSDWFFIRSKNQEQAAKLLASDGWAVEKE